MITQTQHIMQKKKLCLLGDIGVGKTSLIERYVYSRFDERYLSTIGVRVSQKLLEPIEDSNGAMRQYNLMIWDIEGFEPDSKIGTDYYLGAAGGLIVVDVTRRSSLTGVPRIVEAFMKVAPSAQLILAANKTDLLKRSTSDWLELEQFTLSNKLPLFFTSAKNGEHVAECFQKMAVLLNG